METSKQYQIPILTPWIKWRFIKIRTKHFGYQPIHFRENVKLQFLLGFIFLWNSSLWNCPFLAENHQKMSMFWAKMMILNLLWFEIFKIDLTTMKWYLSGQYRIYKERSLVCWYCFHHYWMILLLWSTLVGTLNFPNHQLGKSKYVCNLRQICSRNF